MSSTARIIDTASGEIALVAPYNASAVTACKRLNGRFGTLKIKDGDTVKAWFFRDQNRSAVEHIVSTLYPSTDTLTECVIEWCTGEATYSGSPMLNGLALYPWLGRDNRGRLANNDVLEILQDTLHTCGSRACPDMRGSLTARCLINSLLDNAAGWQFGVNNTVRVITLASWEEEQEQRRAASAQNDASRAVVEAARILAEGSPQ